MAAFIIRSLSVVLGIRITAAYFFSLYLLTYGACFMRDVGCPQGWIARTIGTVVYLAVVAVAIFVTRKLLRAAAGRET